MEKHIDKIEIGDDSWYVYKISDLHYKYQFWPDSIMGEDSSYKIDIEYNKKNNNYDIKVEEYFEIYGSGDWGEWKNCDEEIKEEVLNDFKNRINNKKNKKFSRFDIMDIG